MSQILFDSISREDQRKVIIDNCKKWPDWENFLDNHKKELESTESNLRPVFDNLFTFIENHKKRMRKEGYRI